MLDRNEKSVYNVYIVRKDRKIIWSDVVFAESENEAIRVGLYVFQKKTGTKITQKFLQYFSVNAEILQ